LSCSYRSVSSRTLKVDHEARHTYRSPRQPTLQGSCRSPPKLEIGRFIEDFRPCSAASRTTAASHPPFGRRASEIPGAPSQAPVDVVLQRDGRCGLRGARVHQDDARADTNLEPFALSSCSSAFAFMKLIGGAVLKSNARISPDGLWIATPRRHGRLRDPHAVVSSAPSACRCPTTPVFRSGRHAGTSSITRRRARVR
jgi:hypothetical protein